jgi:dUTP pyrophosphatase
MSEINKQLEELKALAEMDMLPNETKEEIRMAIKLAETVQDYGDNTDIDSSINTPVPKKIQIKYINKSSHKNPNYAKEGDSGFDLRANEKGSLKTLERKLVPTGLFFELPDGFELQIRPRSGLAYKHGVTVLNSPGTVDTGYRGEIGVLLVNLSNKEFTWDKGDRIAQGVVSHRISSDYGELVEVVEITESERGSGGFGSTGTK